jgi:hypothetical protein
MLNGLSKALPLGALTAKAGLLISFSQAAHKLEEDSGLGLLFKIRGEAYPALLDCRIPGHRFAQEINQTT